MPNSKRNQLSHHDGKRKHGDLPWHDVAQEETVDDLLIASMAVASTWCDEASPHPAVDNSSASESAIERDDSKENDHDSDHDDIAEADEISISSSNQDGSAPNSKEDDDTELMGQSDNNEKSLNLQVEKEDESDDDGSDIDLTEHLANMEDDDDDAPKNSKGNQAKVAFSIYEGPKTEHEIDPYKCPTDELEKLNVCVGIEMDNIGDPTILDDATRNRLRIAGTIRTYLVDQRTIVVDSLIPAALQKKIAPEPSEEQDDPWCHKGKLSCILRNTPNAIVYSLVDHVKLIDKDLIIRLVAKAAMPQTCLTKRSVPVSNRTSVTMRRNGKLKGETENLDNLANMMAIGKEK
eukprot:CCRYP_019020-RA/>CCRYP_019020-RA protein AED:0.13 eAED:0.13 QI:0/0.5/0.33/1/0/0/3/1180/348